MKVRELIAELQKLDPEMPVVSVVEEAGYEYGDPAIDPVWITLDHGCPFYAREGQPGAVPAVRL